MALVEKTSSQEHSPLPDFPSNLALVLGPEQTIEQVHEQATALARELTATEKRWSFAQLLTICFLLLLLGVVSQQSVSAETVTDFLEQQPPTFEQKVPDSTLPKVTATATFGRTPTRTVTPTVTPTATSTPTATPSPTITPLPTPREGEFSHGSIMGRSFGTYIYAAQDNDFAIIIKPSEAVQAGTKTIPGVESQQVAPITVADLDTYIGWLVESAEFKTVFPGEIETVQQQVTGYTVELTRMVERVTNQTLELELAVEVVISYLDEQQQPQTVTFIITMGGPIEELLQDAPELTYSIKQKQAEQPQLPVEVENIEPVIDMRQQLSSDYLEKILGREQITVLERRGVDLLELSHTQVPVRVGLGGRNEVVTLTSQYDTVSGFGTSSEPRVGELGFSDPRFGSVSIVDPRYDQATDTEAGTVIGVSAADQAGVVLQLRLPPEVTVQKTDTVTVTADKYAQTVIFEGLDLVDAESVPKGYRAVLILQQSLYTELDSRLTSTLTEAEDALLTQLAGDHLVRVLVPENAQLVAAEGYVFSVEPSQPLAKLQLVAGPYIFTERNQPIPVLTYPAEFRLPIESLVQQKLGKELAEGWQLTNFSISGLSVQPQVTTHEMELTVNLSLTVVDKTAQQQYQLWGELPMIFDIQSSQNGQVLPRGTAYSFIEAKAAPLNPPTPIPELSEQQKLEQTEATVQAEPQTAAIWQLIKALSSLKQTATPNGLVIGFNGYEVSSVKNEVLNKLGDLEAAIPDFKLGSGFTLLIYTDQENYEGFNGTVTWVPSQDSGYFVAAQDFKINQKFTAEVAALIKNLKVPMVLSGQVAYFSAQTTLPIFALQNPDVTSASFDEAVQAGQIELPKDTTSPLQASEKEQALKTPQTTAGQRLFSFIAELKKSVTAHEVEGVVMVNGYTLETLLDNPYLFDTIDQSDMRLTLAATSVENKGIWQIMADATFSYDTDRYHIAVAPGSEYAGATFDILYAMQGVGPIRYNDGRKEYTLGDE